jgi:hypothetical protein
MSSRNIILEERGKKGGYGIAMEIGVESRSIIVARLKNATDVGIGTLLVIGYG